jgi:hypothetical protein
MKFLFSIFISLLFLGCTHPEKATMTLKQNGYTDIQMTGYNWWMCHKGEIWATGFKAKSISGYQVEGCVCEGLFSSTIRLK